MKYFNKATNWYYRLFGIQTKLHCIGDSHIRYFEYIAKEYLLPATEMKFCVVQGATNMGLANPHSKTKAMPIFMDYLDTIDTKDYVVFCLGEVDCGFVIWYRAEKHITTVQEQFNESLNNYFGLLGKYLEKILSDHLVLCSVPLPTIPDNKKVTSEVANKRLGIKASILDRTRLTIKYNEKLREFCKQYGLQYLDLQSLTLDEKTGVVSDEYLNQNSSDHHLDSKKIATLLVPKMKLLGFH